MELPKKIALYYDSPINISNSLQNVVDILSEYDVIILGENLANPSHQNYISTTNIISELLLLNTDIYGYVKLTKTSVINSVNQWDNLNTTGIFIDEFGDDYGNTRDDQNALLDHIHSKNMNCMLNSILSVFDNTPNPFNPNGDSLNYLSSDWYVYMGFGVSNNTYNNPVNNSNLLKNYNIKVCCIATSNGIFNQNLADYSYYLSVLMEFEGWGWGELNFSGSLPFRKRKKIIGDTFTSLLQNESGIYYRDTNVGIVIDTNNKSVNFILK